MSLIVSLVIRADARRAATVTALQFVEALSVGVWPLWLKLLADAAVNGDSRLALIAGLGVAAMSTVMVFAGWLGFNAQLVLQERANMLLDERLSELSLSIPSLAHHEHPKYQDKFALLMEDRGQLGQSLQAILGGLQQLVRFSVTIILLATIHPVLVLLAAFGFALILSGRKAESYRKHAMEAMVEPLRTADFLFRTATTAGSIKELMIFGLGNEFLNRHRNIWNAADKARTRAEAKGMALNTGGWAIFAAGYAAAVTFVVWRATTGSATAGDVLMALGLAVQVHEHIGGGAGVFTWFLRTLQALKRLLWLSDYAADQTHGPTTTLRMVPDRITQGIDIHEVSFRYQQEQGDVLSDVSLRLPAGTTVAFVGENGAGKTTLVKLLCRFYDPDEGSISLDGVDLREFDHEKWRLHIAAGFQDFVRFEFVVRETVGVGDLQVMAPDTVGRALARASAEDVVTRLTNGLETQLGRQWNGGVDLSTGQWQKLALARALMRTRPLLLVLDEPTASLDSVTEHQLFSNYVAATREMARKVGTITVLVSHRFSTVRMADRIVVVDGGRVIEVGSHDELLALDGLYSQLYTLQAQAYR